MAGILASFSTITYPAISSYVSVHSDEDKQGGVFSAHISASEKGSFDLFQFLICCQWGVGLHTFNILKLNKFFF